LSAPNATPISEFAVFMMWNSSEFASTVLSLAGTHATARPSVCTQGAAAAAAGVVDEIEFCPTPQ
jgi:hypothetical protein